MIDGVKATDIINKYLMLGVGTFEKSVYPIGLPTLCENRELREELIDFLGDIYIYTGLDNNYNETPCGIEIQEAIHFLAYCNGKDQQ